MNMQSCEWSETRWSNGTDYRYAKYSNRYRINEIDRSGISYTGIYIYILLQYRSLSVLTVRFTSIGIDRRKKDRLTLLHNSYLRTQKSQLTSIAEVGPTYRFQSSPAST